MENVNHARQHPDSHLSASSSSDSSLELSTHPKESLGDIYTKPEQDAFVSPSTSALSFPNVSSQTPQWSMMSASPLAETGNSFFSDAFPQNVEPMKSPPSHTMDHPPGYDPNRIPKSIFSSKPTTPEWSTASNESLFSIQMGANSFSTDYSYLLPKSGEVLPEEWKNSTANPYYASEVKSNDIKNLSSPLPPLIEVSRDNDGKSTKSLEVPSIDNDGKSARALEVPSINNDGKNARALEVPSINNDGKNARALEVPSINNDGKSARALEVPGIDNDGKTARALEVPSINNDGKNARALEVPSINNDGKSARALEVPGIQEKNIVENPKVIPEEKPVNNIKQKTTNVIEEHAATTSNKPDDHRVVPPNEASRISSPAHTSSPCHSEASGNSSSSFAFPLLVNDGGKSNSLKGASEKVEKPQPQPQPQHQEEFQPEKQPQQKQSETQPKVVEKSWCSCFTCWPRCC